MNTARKQARERLRILKGVLIIYGIGGWVKLRGDRGYVTFYPKEGGHVTYITHYSYVLTMGGLSNFPTESRGATSFSRQPEWGLCNFRSQKKNHLAPMLHK